MSTKLTLRLDEELIAAAKRYARSQKRSVSVLVADYFAQLTTPPATLPSGTSIVTSLTPIGTITSQLRGAWQANHVNEVDEYDYKRYLESKYL
ncbi:MAG: hypothetical protein RLZZ495_408 [Pseudomonadota bacterium]|jgi:hypothetical protein